MVGIGEVQQIETGERGEDSAIPAQKALEATGGESALVEEGKTDRLLFSDQDGKLFGKERRASTSQMRKEGFTQAKGLSEESESGIRGIEDGITEMVEDEVHDHEAGLNLRITLQSAVLRSTQPDCRIHLFGCEVIDKASLPTGDGLEMTERGSFAEELRGDSPALPLYEAAIVPAQEVTGVQGD